MKPMLASSREVRSYTVIDHEGDGTEYVLTDYLGAMGKDIPGPQSFLSETSSATATFRPHFHTVNQFQVFWAGARVGKREIDPIHVHYADAYTVYGPLAASPAGMAFMTVRAKADPGPRYMPGAKSERSGKPRGRHLEAKVVVPSLGEAVPGIETVLGPWDDGLAVHLVILEAGAPLPTFAPSGGVHYLVIGGALNYQAVDHPPLSDFFVDGEDADGAVAGDPGLIALVLQFPTSPR